MNHETQARNYLLNQWEVLKSFFAVKALYKSINASIEAFSRIEPKLTRQEITRDLKIIFVMNDAEANAFVELYLNDQPEVEL